MTTLMPPQLDVVNVPKERAPTCETRLPRDLLCPPAILNIKKATCCGDCRASRYWCSGCIQTGHGWAVVHGLGSNLGHWKRFASQKCLPIQEHSKGCRDSKELRLLIIRFISRFKSELG